MSSFNGGSESSAPIGQLMGAEDSSRPGVGTAQSLIMASIGIGGFIVGALAVSLWRPGGEPAVMAPAVSVYTCAQQYTIVAEALNGLVSEGIDAGQASTPDVSWINSIHERQEVYAGQLETLNDGCSE